MRWLAIVLLLVPALGRCGGFTPIVDGLSWTGTNIINELVGAFNERAEVRNATTNDYYQVGESAIKVGSLYGPNFTWRKLQVAAVSVAYNYVDHTAAQTNDDDFVIFGSDGVYAAAGIHTNGFRRAETNWPAAWTNLDDAAFTYGLAEQGDLMGPWILDDLQKVLSAMQWTWADAGHSIGYDIDSTNRQEYVADPVWSTLSTNCTTTRDEHLSDWAATNWVAMSDDNPYFARAQRSYSAITKKYRFSAERRHAKIYCDGIHTNVPHEAELYFVFRDQSDLSQNGVPPDMDGIGFSEYTLTNNYLFSVEEFSEATTDYRLSGYVDGSTTVSPVAAIPVECGASTTNFTLYATLNNLKWVFKWVFTTSN